MAGMPPQALIFDMDGLMIDSEPLWLSIEHRLAESYGKTWSKELALRCVGTGLPNTARVMIEELDLPLDVPRGTHVLVEAFIERAPELTLKDGCLDLIDAAEAAGLSLAVASSSTRRLIDAVLAAFELRPRFDAVVSGDDVVHNKPAPDIFLRAAELLGAAPGDCVVLEDSLPGATGAKRGHIPVIAVPEHAPERFASVTPWVVSDLIEARAILQL